MANNKIILDIFKVIAANNNREVQATTIIFIYYHYLIIITVKMAKVMMLLTVIMFHVATKIFWVFICFSAQKDWTTTEAQVKTKGKVFSSQEWRKYFEGKSLNISKTK